MKFLNFSYFSGGHFAVLNPDPDSQYDPDPQTQLKPDSKHFIFIHLETRWASKEEYSIIWAGTITYKTPRLYIPGHLVTIYALELPCCQMIPFCPRHAPKQKLANSKRRPFTEDCSVCLERLPAIGPGPGRYQPISSEKSSVVDLRLFTIALIN